MQNKSERNQTRQAISRRAAAHALEAATMSMSCAVILSKYSEVVFCVCDVPHKTSKPGNNGVFVVKSFTGAQLF
jgi:hypothetical protein